MVGTSAEALIGYALIMQRKVDRKDTYERILVRYVGRTLTKAN